MLSNLSVEGSFTIVAIPAFEKFSVYNLLSFCLFCSFTLNNLLSSKPVQVSLDSLTIIIAY